MGSVQSARGPQCESRTLSCAGAPTRPLEVKLKKQILLVEDDESLREIITDYFTGAGFSITEASDGQKALETLEEADFDLVLLDIMLPHTDGFAICRRLRREKDTPVIIITARSGEDDKLLGYELGADDYVTKPFSPKVLLAKAKNLLRRADGTVIGKEKIIECGRVAINTQSYKVTVDGEKADLSPKEYDLLLTLVENKNRVMSRDELLSKVWGYDYFGDLRTVDTHIKLLRSKLKQGAAHIITQVKVGYKFEEDIQ